MAETKPQEMADEPPVTVFAIGFYLFPLFEEVKS